MKLACNVDLSKGSKTDLISGYLVQVINTSRVVVVDFKGKLHFVDPRNVTVLRREVSL